MRNAGFTPSQWDQPGDKGICFSKFGFKRIFVVRLGIFSDVNALGFIRCSIDFGFRMRRMGMQTKSMAERRERETWTEITHRKWNMWTTHGPHELFWPGIWLQSFKASSSGDLLRVLWLFATMFWLPTMLQPISNHEMNWTIIAQTCSSYCCSYKNQCPRMRTRPVASPNLIPFVASLPIEKWSVEQSIVENWSTDGNRDHHPTYSA